MSGDLLVGYDGSDCAKAALAEAELVASRLGCGLTVAFCAEPPAAYAGGAGDQRRVLEESGNQLLAEALALLSDPSVEVLTVVVHNRPAQGLLAYADEMDAAMIVVGTYSERPIAAALVGSTPHKLLHLSTRPVLVVPVPD